MLPSDKRSHLPTPPSFRSKRLKASNSPDREGEPSTELRQARAANTRGSEWFPLDTTRLDGSTLNDLVLSSAERLKKVGKRPLFPPKVFPEGFAIDWLLDYSVQGEDLKRVLAAGGVSKSSVEAVLSRARRRSAYSTEGADQAIDLTSEDHTNERASAAVTPLPTGTHGDPILVDGISMTRVNGLNAESDHAPRDHRMTVAGRVNDHSMKLDDIIDVALAPLLTHKSATKSHERTQLRAISGLPAQLAGQLPIQREVPLRSVSTPATSRQHMLDEASPPRLHISVSPCSSRGSEIGHDNRAQTSTRSNSIIFVRSTCPAAQSPLHRRTVIGGGTTAGCSNHHDTPTSIGSDAQTGSSASQEQPVNVDVDSSMSDETSSQSTESNSEDDRESEGGQNAIATTPTPTRSPQAHAHSSTTGTQSAREAFLRRHSLAKYNVVNIPKAKYARGRRLLIPADTNLPYTMVAMRGDAQFIERNRMSWISRFSLPAPDDEPPALHVEDCCLLGSDVVCIGYDTRPCQISLLSLAADKRPMRFDLSHRAHNTVYENPTTGASQLNPGVSSLAPVNHGNALHFLSGGHDKSVHIWTVEARRKGYIARSERLNICHSRSVHALAYRAFDETIFSCAGPCIVTAKLSGHRVPDPDGISSPVLQVHVHPEAPHLVVLEVRHMDRQIQLYDTRKSGFTRAPCLEWGYRDSAHRRGNSQPRSSTRYTKGSMCLSYFGRGYTDGTVCVWDFRQPSNVLTSFQSQRDTEVVHTVLTDSGSTVVAYGGHSVSVYGLRGGRT